MGEFPILETFPYGGSMVSANRESRAMISNPKVSVVMSAFNASEYLDEAVSSILDQTFHDFEFIIINNGSSDETGAILDKYQKRDDRLRVYYKEQEGLAPALNRACNLARGQYVAL